MKQYDIVKLNNLRDEYAQFNLYLNVQGIILEYSNNISKVLFLNEHNQGDYAYLNVINKDLDVLSNNSGSLDFFKDNIKNFVPKEKGFQEKLFKAYQQVELLVEDEKYSKYGVHKGDKGTIMEDYAVKDYVLVDFGKLDADYNYTGDCISINLKDLKIYDKKQD